MLPQIDIGEIAFAINADSFIANLLEKHFRRFAGKNGEADVFFEIYAVAEDDLTLSFLNDSERKQLATCIFPPFIGPGVLTIPFISPLTVIPCFDNSSRRADHFDVPLLRSEMVRKRLDACWMHPEAVALALHNYSVSIRDYQNRTASVFYWDECRDIIKKSNEPTELFRRLFVSFFPLSSAMLVHAACVVRKNRAALFLAPDEGGKTTVARIADNGIVLGDDRILIKKQGNDIFAHGSPWGTMNDASTSARINAVFLLNKAERFCLQPIDVNQVIEYLWQEHKYDRFFLTNKLKSVVFELIVDLCRQGTVYQMNFAKDYVDWDAVDSALEGKLER